MCKAELSLLCSATINVIKKRNVLLTGTFGSLVDDNSHQSPIYVDAYNLLRGGAVYCLSFLSCFLLFVYLSWTLCLLLNKMKCFLSFPTIPLTLLSHDSRPVSELIATIVAVKMTTYNQ